MTTHDLTVEITIDAPRERVFDAWTTPAQLILDPPNGSWRRDRASMSGA